MAEGFGATATGGAGGRILRVTHLGNSGPGSLREALGTPGPRTIVFEVAGDIVCEPVKPDGAFPLNSAPLRVAGGDVTIDGATAPAPGITLRWRTDRTPFAPSAFNGPLLYFQGPSENVILRQLAIRPGIWPYAAGEKSVENVMCVQFGDSATAGSACRRIVIDQCSMSEATARCISISDATSDLTISHSIFGPGLAKTPERPWLGQTKGLSHHQGSTRITVLNNLYAHLWGRMPQVNGRCDVRGNVIYDWLDFGGYVQNFHPPSFPDPKLTTEVNWIGNTILAGANGSPNRGLIVSDWRGNPGNVGTGALRLCLDDLTQLAGGRAVVNRWNQASGAMEPVPYVGSEYEAAEFAMPPVVVRSKQEVLAGAGRFPRDATDAQLAAELGYQPLAQRRV